MTANWQLIEDTLAEYGTDYEGAHFALVNQGVSETEINNWIYFNLK